MIPLLKLTEADAAGQATRLMEAITAFVTGSLPANQAHAEIQQVLQWLREVIGDPILAALGHTDAPVDDGTWPRVWWCPVGLLAYLPLHAVALDRVVSSYAISARALGYARNRTPAHSVADGQSGTTLVVAVPDAPGVQSLRGAIAEAIAIRELIPDAAVLRGPTRDQVLRELPGYAVAHLSCHGEANMSDPARSRLILPDHATAPLTVADISAQRVDGDLAFLSACSTGHTSPGLSNEAIHLTGAFHLAGFRNVIGTLWPVLDFAASRVTRDFYRGITDGGTRPPDATRAAPTLHDVTRRLRDAYPDAPGIWAAFTHTGP